MPSWFWVLIAVALVLVLGIVVWRLMARRRSGKLQQQFGPEYDRTVGATTARSSMTWSSRAQTTIPPRVNASETNGSLRPPPTE